MEKRGEKILSCGNLAVFRRFIAALKAIASRAREFIFPVLMSVGAVGVLRKNFVFFEWGRAAFFRNFQTKKAVQYALRRLCGSVRRFVLGRVIFVGVGQ
jgi:hypothetical protein